MNESRRSLFLLLGLGFFSMGLLLLPRPLPGFVAYAPGGYIPLAQYKRDDVVSYEGKVWVCLHPGRSGTIFEAHEIPGKYWMRVVGQSIWVSYPDD